MTAIVTFIHIKPNEFPLYIQAFCKINARSQYSSQSRAVVPIGLPTSRRSLQTAPSLMGGFSDAKLRITNEQKHDRKCALKREKVPENETFSQLVLGHGSLTYGPGIWQRAAVALVAITAAV